MKRFVPVLLLLALTAPVLGAGGGLKWTLAANQKLSVKVTIERKTTQTGLDKAAELEVIVEQSWTVKKVDKGGATVEVAFDRVRVKHKGPFGETAYDSGAKEKKPLGSPQAFLYMALAGKKATLTVAADGTLQAVAGFGASMTGALDEMARQHPKTAGLKKFWETLVNDAAFKADLERDLFVFPSNASAKKGTKWQRKAEHPFSVVGTSTHDSTYTVGETQGDAVTVGFESKISFAQKKGLPKPLDLLEVSFKKASGKGEVTFDLKKGRPTGATRQVELEIVVVTKLGDAIQRMEQRISETVRVVVS